MREDKTLRTVLTQRKSFSTTVAAAGNKKSSKRVLWTIKAGAILKKQNIFPFIFFSLSLCQPDKEYSLSLNPLKTYRNGKKLNNNTMK